MTTIQKTEKKPSRRLTLEDINSRRENLKKYILQHPNVKMFDLWNNKELRKTFNLYSGRVEVAIYDVITDEKIPSDVPATHFRGLVSYIASKIAIALEKVNFREASIEDIKQDGMLGVIIARKLVNRKYTSGECSTFLRTCIRGHIWRGLENCFAPVKLPRHALKRISLLNRYNLTLEEARKAKIDYILKNYLDKTFNKLIAISNGENLGTDFLLSIPASTEEIREDMTGVRLNLEDLMKDCLDERSKKIIISRSNSMKLREIGEEISLTRERVRQIERGAYKILKKYMNRLLIEENPVALRLYREYFEK